MVSRALATMSCASVAAATFFSAIAEGNFSRIAAKLPAGHARLVPASELAVKHIGRPVPNAALLGAFAALTGLVHLHSVAAAIRQAFPGQIGDANIAAATATYETIAASAAA